MKGEQRRKGEEEKGSKEKVRRKEVGRRGRKCRRKRGKFEGLMNVSKLKWNKAYIKSKRADMWSSCHSRVKFEYFTEILFRLI